jgi:hypothetical protein
VALSGNALIALCVGQTFIDLYLCFKTGGMQLSVCSAFFTEVI